MTALANANAHANANANVSAALSVAPLASAESVPAERWAMLASRGAHLRAWFAAAERSGWQARHVAIGDPAAPLAVIPAHLVARADHDLHDRWFGPLRGVMAALGLRLRPALTVAAPFVQTSEPLGALDGLADDVLERTFDALEAQGRRDGARAVVWPFLDAAHERLLRLGRARGYAACYAGATAVLPVEWPSFDDYVGSRSKNVRRTIRSDLRALEDAGLRVESTNEFSVHAAAIDALFHDFFRRRNRHPSALPAGFFDGVAARAESGIVAQLAWKGERLVGASLNLTAAGVVDGTFAAFASGYEGGPVYYNDLLYTPLRAACAAGARRLELGPTALYAKVLRGAKLRRRVTLIRGMTPALHALITAWGRAIASRTEAKEREVLAPLGGAACYL